MEALIGLFVGVVEVAFSIVISLLVLVLDLLIWVVGTIITICGGKFSAENHSKKIRGKLKSLKGMLVKASLVIFGVAGIVAAILNFFFFVPTSNFVFTKLLSNQGIEYSTGELEGNFFTGEFRITDLNLKGEKWDVSAQTCHLNLGMLSAIFPHKVFDEVLITGFRGEAIVDAPTPGKKQSRRKRYPKVEIKNLSVSDAKMTLSYADNTSPPIHNIEVNHLDSESFWVRQPLFYLFFRSNLEGKLNDSPLSVKVSDVMPQGKKTSWHTEEIPIALFKGNGQIFDIIEKGNVAIEVTDYWKRSDRLEIEMDWKLVLTDVSADAEQENVIRKAVASFINESPEPIDISFTLTINEGELEGSSSDVAQGIYRSISKAAVKEVAKSRNITIDSAEEARKKLIDGFIKRVDKARKSE